MIDARNAAPVAFNVARPEIEEEEFEMESWDAVRRAREEDWRSCFERWRGDDICGEEGD